MSSSPKKQALSNEESNKNKATVSPDGRYTFDDAALQKLRSSSPWMQSPKYFKKVAVSPTAVARMLMHCQSGCDKGIAKGGNPIEVMGMLLGRPDPETPHTIVVTDAFPLPIEGFETRVVADDEQVVNHMIALGEALEKTRKERFCGWYHSHPFDLGDHSHCFLSQTDLSTQLQWQRAEDPHGNPFVAIVVDPLRSAHLEVPQLKAFRAYPPEFTPPANECPDGSKQTLEQARLELWGSCWNRYYELQVEYFMSDASRAVLESLTKNYLWIRTLTRPSGHLDKLATATDAYEQAMTSGSSNQRPDTATVLVSSRTKELHGAVNILAEAAVQQADHMGMEQAKDKVFS
jgi:COP9 signalosome complex subunit 5